MGSAHRKLKRYRPEIDGLRAIAVIVVIFYHFALGCSGGFVGVDVFFVISGFLISSIIWRELESDKFTLVGFWERRFRRIFPAVTAVIVAAQNLFFANFYFWNESGYFDGPAEAKPLLHTWSLAVEE